MRYLLALVVAIGLTHTTASSQTLSQKRGALQPEVLITTIAPAELAQRASAAALEHDTEVARAESITMVVSIAACEKGENGTCNASSDVVVYKPDGSVHTEVKNLVLNNLRVTAPLSLKANDATGLYKVVATVRDLNGRRFGQAERIFGVQ